MSGSFIFTSESVSEGHPDKVCDYIADSILDAHLAQDPKSRVACEVMCKDARVVIAGEITSAARVDVKAVARGTINEIGYNDASRRFNAAAVSVLNLLGQQAADIARGVDNGHDLGAGDQGLMFGFATDETPELMPLPISLAHSLTRSLAEARKSSRVSWLRPDAKSQVSVRYENGKPVEVSAVVVSSQHRPGTTQEEIHEFIDTKLLPEALGKWWHEGIKLFVNPAGEFSIGGPEGDCGVTGRKIIADTYGGFARHGGGAFSGKDPTKVDRSGAYFARFVAQQIVTRGLATKAEIQVAYAIGVAQPVSTSVDTCGTGNQFLAEQFAAQFDYRPAAIIERLDLLKPIYRSTTNYGHFGKPHLAWEQ
ncbi:MAG: methionine adenosyltransferase [Chthoniobacterales bacterium]|nr:methionine adenosyltransferase [Chthoniobacterales bacterium]